MPRKENGSNNRPASNEKRNNSAAAAANNRVIDARKKLEELLASNSPNKNAIQTLLATNADLLRLSEYPDILLLAQSPDIYAALVKAGATISSNPADQAEHLKAAVKNNHAEMVQQVLDRKQVDLKNMNRLLFMTESAAILRMLVAAGVPTHLDTEGRRNLTTRKLSIHLSNNTMPDPEYYMEWLRMGANPYLEINSQDEMRDYPAQYFCDEYLIFLVKETTMNHFHELVDMLDLSVHTRMMTSLIVEYIDNKHQSTRDRILNMIEYLLEAQQKASPDGNSLLPSIYPTDAPYVPLNTEDEFMHPMFLILRHYYDCQPILELLLKMGTNPVHRFTMRWFGTLATSKSIQSIHWISIMDQMHKAHPEYQRQMDVRIHNFTPIDVFLASLASHQTENRFKMLEAALSLAGFVKNQPFDAPFHELISDETIDRLVKENPPPANATKQKIQEHRREIYRAQKKAYFKAIEESSLAARHRAATRYFLLSMAKVEWIDPQTVGPPLCSVYHLRTDNPEIYKLIRALMESFLPIGDEDDPSPRLYLHDHPIYYQDVDAGASFEFIEDHVREHLKDSNKDAVPCYMIPYCKRPFTKMEVSACITDQELLEAYLNPPPPKTGMNQNVGLYNAALRNERKPSTFGKQHASTMCPYCLRAEERGSGCVYMKHEGSLQPNGAEPLPMPQCDRYFLVEELRKKWFKAGREASAAYAAQEGIENLGAVSDLLEFCAECGRPCWQHHHLELEPNAEGKYRFVNHLARPSPEYDPTYPAAHQGASLCNSKFGRVELFARMLAARDVYHSGQYTNPKEERRQAALAADKAPLDPAYIARAKAIFDQELSQRKWNVNVANTHHYNNQAYQNNNASAASAAAANNNGNEKENQAGGKRSTRHKRRKTQKKRRAARRKTHKGRRPQKKN